MRRIAVVTGASAGIGREIALGLARAGVEVLAVARRADLLTRLATDPGIQAVPADVTTGDGVERVAAAVADRPVACLVHGAGVFPRGRLVTLPPAVWRAAFDVNVHARLALTLRLRSPLRHGRVLFIGSDAARTARIGGAAYSVSKAASEMLWRCLATELGDEIAFGLMRPGLVATSMLDESLATPRDAFPAGEVYAAMVTRGEVIAAATVAAFSRFLLVETTVEEFGREVWDIRDASHHARWLSGPLFRGPSG